MIRMKYKSFIITALIVTIALAGAWLYGGNYHSGESDAQPALALSKSASGNAGLAASEETLPAPDLPGFAAEETPAPVDPENVTVGDGSFTVLLSVHCETILNNMSLLDKEKHELIPPDGVVFPTMEVTAYEGESVFNVFQREMKRARIHMSFRNTPVYNSAYILDVNNLYEFDAGELSGWMYKVNDWYPNYGCSRYQLNPGDVIEWVFSCDLGRDVGGEWLGGRQIDD